MSWNQPERLIAFIRGDHDNRSRDAFKRSLKSATFFRSLNNVNSSRYIGIFVVDSGNLVICCQVVDSNLADPGFGHDGIDDHFPRYALPSLGVIVTAVWSCCFSMAVITLLDLAHGGVGGETLVVEVLVSARTPCAPTISNIDDE